MQPPVRALFTACEIDGVTVVSAEIPGVDIADRPVFYKGVGRVKGSYVRVGESDEPMNEYEVYSYEAFRKRVRDDIRVVENTKFSLVDETRMAQYLQAVRNERKNLAENVSDAEILELMGIYERQHADACGTDDVFQISANIFSSVMYYSCRAPGNRARYCRRRWRALS